MKRISKIVLIFLAVSPFAGQAQDNVDELIKGSLKDANTLVSGYVSPLLKGMGAGLNQGWYNTAKPHKLGGVDLTITTSLMYIPTSDKFYTIDNSKLDEIQLVSYDGQAVAPNGSAKVPTIFGPEKAPTYTDKATGLSSFNGPEGLDFKKNIGINAMPVPIAHLGIGLPKGTDLKIRFSPTLNLGSGGKFSLFGLGVMHDIKQYIPGIKSLPFDLSAFIGYTKTKLESDISGSTAGANQRASLQFSTTTIQGLISKKVSVLTVYGGLGYNLVKAKVGVLGTYDLDDNGSPETTDPVKFNTKNNGFRMTGGLRLKLAVFTFSADYTIAKYKALSLGFGINVR